MYPAWGFSEASGILSPASAWGQSVVSFPFQGRAYTLIQGQPFQKPMIWLWRRRGRQHHRSGRKDVPHDEYTGYTKDDCQWFSGLSSRDETAKSQTCYSFIWGTSLLAFEEYGTAGLSVKKRYISWYCLQGMRGGTLQKSWQMVFRRRIP